MFYCRVAGVPTAGSKGIDPFRTIDLPEQRFYNNDRFSGSGFMRSIGSWDRSVHEIDRFMSNRSVHERSIGSWDRYFTSTIDTKQRFYINDQRKREKEKKKKKEEKEKKRSIGSSWEIDRFIMRDRSVQWEIDRFMRSRFHINDRRQTEILHQRSKKERRKREKDEKRKMEKREKEKKTKKSAKSHISPFLLITSPLSFTLSIYSVPMNANQEISADNSTPDSISHHQTSWCRDNCEPVLPIKGLWWRGGRIGTHRRRNHGVSRQHVYSGRHHHIASLNCNHRCVIALECFNATSPYESSFYTSPQHCRRWYTDRLGKINYHSVKLWQ